jgi:flagellar biosynthetic protein FlhB
MADERTEKATPKRRDEARRKGQIARSADLTAALMLVVAIGVVAATASSMMAGLTSVVSQGLGQSGEVNLASSAGMSQLAGWGARSMLSILAPVTGAVVLAAIAGNALQNRPRITMEAIRPQWGRVNPAAGLKRLLGPRGLFDTAKTLAKAGVAALAAFLAIWPQMTRFDELVGAPPEQILSAAAGDVLTLALYVSGAFLLLSVVDFVWQRRQLEKALRMTKEEVRQESRQSDLAPEVRRALRRRQFQLARKRMIAEVATADVVVTNPTHFAVALRYDGSRPAPEVVAKGADLVAAAIREAAEDAGVPVLSNPPLARALHAEVEIGQMIPDSFFQAVAEVLAFVYRTAGSRRRRAAAA